LLLVMRLAWEATWPHTLTAGSAFGSFMVFASMVTRYAARSDAMTENLRALNAELLATRTLLEHGARDAERLRLSRELHDVAGHGLTALKLNLGVLARDSAQPDPERVALCAQLADELLQNLRAVVQQMRLHEGLELRAAISRIATPFPRPVVELDIESDLRIEGFDRAEAVLRAVQEGLTNAARHGAAEHIRIRARRENGQIRLELRDDGKSRGPLQPGNGLTGMRERLQAVDGGMQIERCDEGGVRLQAWVPLRAGIRDL
jgi:signal transduction histidine kinase